MYLDGFPNQYLLHIWHQGEFWRKDWKLAKAAKRQWIGVTGGEGELDTVQILYEFFYCQKGIPGMKQFRKGNN